MINKLKIILNKKQQVYALLLFVGICISSILEMVGVGSIPLFINLLLKPEQLISYFPQMDFIISFASRNYLHQILFGATILLVIFSFKNFFLFCIIYFQAILLKQVNIENSKRLFQGYLQSPYSFHLNRNSAMISRNLTHDVLMSSKHLDSFIYVVREILVIVVIFALLLMVDPITVLSVFFVIVFFSVIFHFFIGKKVTHLSKLAQFHRGRQLQFVNQVFGAIKDTKILARELFFVNAFKNETKGVEKSIFFSKIVDSLPRFLLEILGIISILLVTILFVINGKSADSMISTLALLGVATIRMLPAFTLASTRLVSMRSSIVSLDLIINELKNLDKYTYEKNNDIKINKSKHKPFSKVIELKNISYKYPETNKDILKNISLVIKSKSSIGIIGSTGAGKSTLINILLGLLKPSYGQVLVDGNNINENYLMWQKQIGYISQDIYLIDDTIRRNIAFGIADDDIKEENVNRSIKLAQLNKFISDLPLGLDTVVGDRGIRLSGGQRQRIGIARALYRETEILVLDEATSSLDVETEKKLIQDIESLKGNYTLIIVTHRLSTIKNCEKIILLSNGELVDHGNFDELVLRHDALKTDLITKKQQQK